MQLKIQLLLLLSITNLCAMKQADTMKLDSMPDDLESFIRKRKIQEMLLKDAFMRPQDMTPEQVRQLVAHDCDLNTTDEKGRTLLINLAHYNNMQETIKALIAHGADVEKIDKLGYTLLIIAAHRQPALVRTLCEMGTNVNSSGVNNWTALHTAAVYELEQVKELLDGGADRTIKTVDGSRTAADCARRHGNHEIARLLSLPKKIA